LDVGCETRPARAFDFTASEADVRKAAIVEPLERADVATAAPFERQPVRHRTQRLREPAHGLSHELAHPAAALTIGLDPKLMDRGR
jgi:hypothetical protein